MPFIRRLVVHLIPIIVAMVTFSLLVEPIRTGQISVFLGLGVIVAAYVLGCVLVVTAIAVTTGTRPSQWIALWRQLFKSRGRGRGYK